MFRIRRWFVPVVVALIAGCQSWQVSQVAPAPLLAAKERNAVRIERRSGQQLQVEHPQIRGDTLYGRANGAAAAVALSDITSIAVLKGDPAKSVLLVFGILGTAFAAAAIALASSSWGLGY